MGGTVRFRPFLLGGVFNATGNKAPIEVAAKAPYLATDCARWARRLGVPFAWPPKFPVLTVLPLRAAFAAEKARQARALHPRHVPGLLRPRGATSPTRRWWPTWRPGPASTARRSSPRPPNYKDALKAQTQEAVDRGSFGAPTLFVGQEMFIGNDRLDFAIEALAAAGKG